MSNQLR